MSAAWIINTPITVCWFKRFSSTFHHKKTKPKIKPRNPTSFAKQTYRPEGEILYGLHPVSLALQANLRKFHRLFVLSDSTRALEVASMAKLQGVAVSTITCRKTMDYLAATSTSETSSSSGRGVHQGICADVSSLTLPPAKGNWSEDDGRLWVMACGVGDPYNLGAILRSCYFLGADRVFVCDTQDKGSSRPSPVVSKASSGVLEVFLPCQVHDPLEFLTSVRDSGRLVICGSSRPPKDSDSGEQPSRGVQKALLLVGNEGQGVPDHLANLCTSFAWVAPGRQLHPLVDSLNVSVASALLVKMLKEKLDLASDCPMRLD